MFILFITLLLASLAGLAGHLYVTLTLQAETVHATCALFNNEQMSQGMLSYALALLAYDKEVRQKIAYQKELKVTCDRWNNSAGDFAKGIITYRLITEGCSIDVVLYRHDNFCGGIRAVIAYEEAGEKNVYSCVAIEPF